MPRRHFGGSFFSPDREGVRRNASSAPVKGRQHQAHTGYQANSEGKINIDRDPCWYGAVARPVDKKNLIARIFYTSAGNVFPFVSGPIGEQAVVKGSSLSDELPETDINLF